MSFSRTLFAVPFAIAFLAACEGTPIEGEGEEGEGEAGDCGRNGDCALGNVCVDGACVFGCDEDRDCPGGFACSEDVGAHGACEVIAEGEGEEGEGEGEEGEGELPGACDDILIAVDGDNAGVIEDRRSLQHGSCNAGRGAEEVWRYTAAAPGAVVVGVVHAEDVTVDVDLYAADVCGGVEAGCSSALGDDRVVVRMQPDQDTVDFIVDAFLLHSSGRYTLSIGTPIVVDEGDDCDDFHVCSLGNECVGGACVAEADVFCAGEVAVSGAVTAVVNGVADGPACGGNTADREGAALAHTMQDAGALVVRSGFGFGLTDAVVEVRDGCDGNDVAGACAVVDFNSELVVPNLAAGQTVHLAVFPIGATSVDLEVVERVQLASGRPCQPGSQDAVCGPPDACLGPPGDETCTVAQGVALGEDCDPENSAQFCLVGECVANAGGPSQGRCIDRLAELCADATVAASGTQTLDLDAAFDGADLSCGFAGDRDRALTYTVVGENARVRFDAFSLSNRFVSVALRDRCTDLGDQTCQSASGGLSVTSGGLHAGDTVAVLVESDADVRLIVTEELLTEVAAGQPCDPQSETALCESGTSCVGGPSPRAFVCGDVVVSGDGGSCIEGSTDAVCDVGLLCDVDTCGETPAATSGSFNVQLGAGATSSNAVGDNCAQRQATNVNFTRIAMSNPGNVSASVTVTTTGDNDTVLGAYIPAFNPQSATQQCIASDDDIVSGNLNSRITFNLPAQTSGELIVWPFRAGETFNFGITYTSTAPIAVVAP